MSVVRYDAASGPSGGPTPGARALEAHWKKVTGLGSSGIYNPRPVRGKKSWSTHAEGRAFDARANANSPAEKAKADRYCQFLIDNAVQLQCQYLIWNRRSWKSGRGWRTYSGVSPHTDHIHIELNRDGARDVTLRQLDALWAAWNDDHDAPDQEEPVTPQDIEKIANEVTDRVVLHLANLFDQIDTAMAERGLVADAEGGAIGELRRNVRSIASKVGAEHEK